MMRARLAGWIGLGFGMILGLGACSLNVQRVNPNKITDISTHWNDTDANDVAHAMITQCLSSAWLSDATAKLGHEPRVIVGTIRNKSYEHINVDTFIESLQRELINSGKVQFVASANQRGALRAERMDMDLNASAATRKAMGQEWGADYMLQGTLDAIKQQEGRTEVMYYQVNLQLINLLTNNIAWIGEKKIKKYMTRPAFGW